MEYSSAIKKEKLNFVIHGNLDMSAGNGGEWGKKKPVLQSYVLYDSIYITFLK